MYPGIFNISLCRKEKPSLASFIYLILLRVFKYFI